MYKIINIEKNSIAQEMGIEKGDSLISINDKNIIDIFDYRYLTKTEYMIVLIEKKTTAQQWELEIEKDEDEDLGIIFENPLIECEKNCKNKCIFCFIDQNPTGMRQTIYFKDDDMRLSFLDGNFVTLTNISDSEFERIIFYRLSPINISVHTTDPALRVFMLKNPRAAFVVEQIKKLTNQGIITNFQIVLCRGVNDCEHLDKSIEDLAQFFAFSYGVCVVPAGLTNHRQNLYQIQPATTEWAISVIEQITAWQKKFIKDIGTNFVFLADEFYVLANRPIPPAVHYESYAHIQNGVGMLRSFIEEFEQEFKTQNKKPKTKEISVVTGQIAFFYIKKMAQKIEKKFDITVHVYPVYNNFFGESVTVAGLLTGGDIVAQLQNKKLGNRLLLPSCMLKNNENLLLDNMSIEDMQATLGITIIPTNVAGDEFLRKAIGV